MTPVVYSLPFDEEEELLQGPAEHDHSPPLGLVVRSLIWFPRMRFATASAFLLFGLAGLVGKGFFAKIGLTVPYRWSILTAAILGVMNLGFLWQAKAVIADRSIDRARAALWTQIVLDLLVLTAAVHFFGSVSSFAPFAYLFYIAPACVFFPRKDSLLVMLLACALFTGCVAAETMGVVPPSSIFMRPPMWKRYANGANELTLPKKCTAAVRTSRSSTIWVQSAARARSIDGRLSPPSPARGSPGS